MEDEFDAIPEETRDYESYFANGGEDKSRSFFGGAKSSQKNSGSKISKIRVYSNEMKKMEMFEKDEIKGREIEKQENQE